MFEFIFLFLLALVFIIFAVVQDLKSREIANWLNWSLVIFALGFRFFWSLFQGEWSFFYQGLIGFGIFFVLGNLFYYTHLFAGGDAKLMGTLGAVIPFSSDFASNLEIFLFFIFSFLIIGAVYGLGVTIFFSFRKWKKFKKEFFVQFGKNKLVVYLGIAFAILLIAFNSVSSLFVYLGILMFVISYLYIYAKAVDAVCMVREVSVNKLTEGDWLYEDVFINGKKIKATWDGLLTEDIVLLKKCKKTVLVRYGIQFAPVFLISFLFLGISFFLDWLGKIFSFFI